VIVVQPLVFSSRMISVAGMRAGSRTTERVIPQRSSNPCSCETISLGEPIHTKGDARTSLVDAPGMTFAISPARVPASSVSSTCWTSASMVGVRLAESAADRIRPNVESRVETPHGLVGVSIRQRLSESGNTHDVCASGGECEKARAVPPDHE
jgi:hypothetical protein